MRETEPSPDDLLVSSCLDGTASPDQRAQVARDPSLAGRLEAFRQVADQVAGAVAPPDPAVRDAVIANALDSFDPTARVDASTAEAEHVDELAAARARRSAAPRLLVAAAILAVLALPAIIALARRSSETSSSDLASGAPSSTEAPAEPGAAPNGAESIDSYSSSSSPGPSTSSAASQPKSAATSAFASPVAGDLGSASTTDELRSRVSLALSGPDANAEGASPTSSTTRQAAPPPTDGAAMQSGDPATCEGAARAAIEGDTDLMLAGTITYSGQQAYVHAFTTASGTVVVATSADPSTNCAVLATASL